MCGRYFIEIGSSELSDIVAEAVKNIRERSNMQSFAGGEIFPSENAPVIAEDGPVFMTWGYPALFADRKPHINARSETAAALKTFSDSMAARRCIIPATGYYEWKKTDEKYKEKYMFILPNLIPLYMAGIYSKEGQFVILTREAAPAIYEIHSRMPVILPQALIDVWLRETPEVLEEALTNLLFEHVSALDFSMLRLTRAEIKKIFGW